jgi:hypothetical protein
MTLAVSTQIAAMVQKHAADRTTLETLLAGLDDKPADTTILAQSESLSATITSDAATIAALQNAERALMARAVPVAPGILHYRQPEKFKADHIWRAGVVMLDAYHTRRSIEEVVAERYPGSELTRDLCTLALNRDRPGGGYEALHREVLTRAAQGPAKTDVAGYAAELVHQTYAAWMDVLKSSSAVAQVDWRSDTFENGAPIVVPFRQARAAFPDNFDAVFRKEGDPIRVGRLTTGSKSISPYSMAVIGTFTRELLRRSTPSIEAVIRQAMLDDTAEIIDNVVFGSTAATVGLRPAGLTNGIAAQDTRAATATPTIADINNDLQKMVKQLVAVRKLGGPQTHWVMNTSNVIALSGLLGATGAPIYAPELANGRLKGYRVASSIYYPTTEVLLIDAGAIFMAGGAPEFSMSTEATLHEENTTPLPIGTAGSPATVAAPVRSLYQTNSAALRMIQEISWDILRTGAVQQLTGVAW